MANRVVIALFLSSSASAFAQPSVSPTPTVVETAPTAITNVVPWLVRKGNLRLSIACAEHWVTPDLGLSVSVDGAPIDAQRLNGHWSSYVDSDGNAGTAWNPTDTGYLLAPGRHHVEIDAPDCAASSFDVDAYGDRAEHAEGRLALASSWLEGPVGAPNGVGLSAGVLFLPTPVTGVSSASSTNYTFDPQTTAVGGYFTLSWERRNFAFAFDQAFASGSIGGFATSTLQTFPGDPNPATTTFTGSVFDWRTQLRIGAKLPLHSVALEAGSGLGAELWFFMAQNTNVTSEASPPSGADGSFYLPMWASATFKPGCDWGVQAIGQYDLHPTSMDTNGFSAMAGVMWQPSASCSEQPGVRVSAN